MGRKGVEQTSPELTELRVRLEAAEEAVVAARAALTRLNDGISQDKESAPEGPAGRRLIPLVDWPKYHPWPRVSGLRHLVFEASKTGFDQVIVRIGDRVLLDEQAFFAWAESRHKGRASSSSKQSSAPRGARSR